MKESVSLSVVSHSVIPWTIVCQAPSAHEILQARILEWVAISLSPEDLPDRGVEPRSPALQAYSLLSESPGIAIVRLQLNTSDYSEKLFKIRWGVEETRSSRIRNSSVGRELD